jgi:hypothetical protein
LRPKCASFVRSEKRCVRGEGARSATQMDGLVLCAARDDRDAKRNLVRLRRVIPTAATNPACELSGVSREAYADLRTVRLEMAARWRELRFTCTHYSECDDKSRAVPEYRASRPQLKVSRRCAARDDGGWGSTCLHRDTALRRQDLSLRAQGENLRARLVG